jgi:hypothetical protein
MQVLNLHHLLGYGDCPYGLKANGQVIDSTKGTRETASKLASVNVPIAQSQELDLDEKSRAKQLFA